MMKKTMTRMMAALALVCAACCALAAPVSVWAASGIDMYRLYNRWTGEHFYTASAYERDSLSSVGWEYEGVGWTAPASGEPVYRLYNPYVSGGDHHCVWQEFCRHIGMTESTLWHRLMLTVLPDAGW